MIVGGVVWGNFLFSWSVCMSVYSAGISRVLIKYSGKYVKIYFNMKITFCSWPEIGLALKGLMREPSIFSLREMVRPVI